MEKQTNREHVVAVASQMFLRRGVANTSMDDVVRESGVSKSNIYYHFKSKDELLLAVLDHRVSVFREAVLEPVMRQHGTSVVAALKTFAMTITAEFERRDCVGGCPFMSLAVQAATTNPVVKERVARFFEEQTAQFEKVIAYGVSRGELRQDIDPAEAAGLLMSTIDGSLFIGTLSRDSGLLQSRVLLLLDLLRPSS